MGVEIHLERNTTEATREIIENKLTASYDANSSLDSLTRL